MVASAGNEGNSSWKYITVPADHEKVLAVGATGFEGRKAKFSSFGPSADGRVKPDIVAPGVRIPVSGINNFRVNRSSGTSISAPLVSGLIACLWQAFPEKDNEAIFQAVRQSASQYQEPDNKLGYGLVNFRLAYELLKSPVPVRIGEEE